MFATIMVKELPNTFAVNVRQLSAPSVQNSLAKFPFVPRVVLFAGLITKSAGRQCGNSFKGLDSGGKILRVPFNIRFNTRWLCYVERQFTLCSCLRAGVDRSWRM